MTIFICSDCDCAFCVVGIDAGSCPDCGSPRIEQDAEPVRLGTGTCGNCGEPRASCQCEA